MLILLSVRPAVSVVASGRDWKPVEGSSISSLIPTAPIAKININPFSSGWIYVHSVDGVTIVDAQKKEKTFTNQPIIVTSTGYLVTLNGKPCSHGMWHLVAKNNELSINGNRVTGPATLKITPQTIVLKAQKLTPDVLELTWGYNQNKTAAAASPTIKVLINELLNNQPESVIISSDNGFVFFDPDHPRDKKESFNNSFSIRYKANKLWINDKLYAGNQLRIMPKDGYAGINGTNFHGSFQVINDKDRALLINHVDLEEYVYGVLKSESWPGWPIEVNKAFAIASRSYVMAMIKQGGNKLPYHVKNTNAHQTYNGMHASMTLRTAVQQTRGMFLSHNNEPALAMFDCCCGGIIPANIDDFDFQKAPYLARTYPCVHCKRCKIYSWKKEFSLPEFGKKIAHLVDGSAQTLALHDVKIGKKDKAGLVHELLINPGDNQKKIPGKQFYAALKDIKSFCYNVHRKKDRLIFSGNGYGHHLGICQWGAREMVKDGWPYTRILSFYYPGTKLVKLT